MWFPPYGLKVTEQNSARWNDTIFLGRPEPVYTYQNTSRQGTVQFKVIVDHPSIMNLMVKDHFKNMSDEESENYINAFFAGCEDIDFYGLVRKYTTLSETDVQRIQSYLNKNNDPNTIKRYKTVIRPVPDMPTQKNTIELNIEILNAPSKSLARDVPSHKTPIANIISIDAKDNKNPPTKATINFFII
jgi:hypothetical protein